VRYDHMSADSPSLPAINEELQNSGTIQGLGHMFTWQTWSPRTGFTAKLTNDGKMVMRGSYGRYYSPIYLDNVAGVYPGLSPITTAQFNPATGGYTTVLTVVNPIANIGLDPNVKPQHTDQYAIGIDREVAKNMGFTAIYVRKQGQDELGWTDTGGVYAATPHVLPNGQTLTALSLVNDPSLRKFFLTNPSGFFVRYNGLVLSLNKRYSQRWMATLSYTYSKSEGLIPPTLASTLTTFGQDPNDYVNLSGRLFPEDRPHILNGQASYRIPMIEVTAAANLWVQSGIAYAPQAAVSLPQGRRNINIAAPGTYRTPYQDILNLRLSKNVWEQGGRRIEVMIDIRNLTQGEVYQKVITKNFFNPKFGQPSAWIPPRMALIGGRVNF